MPEIKDEQDKNKLLFGREYNKSNYVFCRGDGTLLQPDYVSKRLIKLLAQHVMPMFSFHNLRHTTASKLVKKGFNIRSIQMWLRHTNVKTTLNVFAHVSEDTKAEIAKGISHMFSIEAH